MNKAEILALADRVEKLDGPDRETDALLAIAVFDGGAEHLDDPREVARARSVLLSHGARPGNFEIVGFSGVSLRTAPAYTASLDAAMTLVEGELLGIAFDVNQHSRWSCEMSTSIADAESKAASPALALVAAALRSRTEGME